MKKNELISIIIPVYNTEDYLDKCLSSIINQTYKNIEIIIIDDGSTDNSKKIIKQYMNKDCRISYYYQNNSGVAIARNSGIDKAQGDYIAFIDSDDYIDLTFIEKMYAAIKDDDVFSICGTIDVLENNDKIYNKINKNLVETFRGIARYRRLINKKILSNSKIKFSNLKVSEDLEFYSKLLIYNNMKYSIVNECLYYYVQRPNSLIHTYSKNQGDTIKAANNIINFCKNNNKYETYKDELEYLYIAHVIIGYTKRVILNGITKEEFTTIFNNIIINFPNWHKNRYINNDEYLPNKYKEYIELLKKKEFNAAISYIKNHFR